MHVGQRQAKGLGCWWCNADIDINGVNRLIAILLAITVATGFPPSGAGAQSHARHHDYSWQPIGFALMVAHLGVSGFRAVSYYLTSVSSAHASSAWVGSRASCAMNTCLTIP